MSLYFNMEMTSWVPCHLHVNFCSYLYYKKPVAVTLERRIDQTTGHQAVHGAPLGPSPPPVSCSWQQGGARGSCGTAGLVVLTACVVRKGSLGAHGLPSAVACGGELLAHSGSGSYAILRAVLVN